MQSWINIYFVWENLNREFILKKSKFDTAPMELVKTGKFHPEEHSFNIGLKKTYRWRYKKHELIDRAENLEISTKN